MFIFWCFLPLFSLANRDADRLFFGNRKWFNTFIPANQWKASGNGPEPSYFTRRWPFRDMRFRVTFNPVRCKEGNTTGPEHEMIFSLLEDHLPLEPITVGDMKNNSIIITGTADHDGNQTLLLRKFRYSLSRFVNGFRYPDKQSPSDEIQLNMINSNFYIMIKRPYLTVFLFRGDTDKLKFRSTIISSSARYFSLFASHWESCPLFISAVDESFPEWVPGKNMSVFRGHVKGPGKRISCFESLIWYCTALFSAAIIIWKALVPTLVNTLIPLFKQKHEERQQAKDDTDMREMHSTLRTDRPSIKAVQPTNETEMKIMKILESRRSKRMPMTPQRKSSEHQTPVVVTNPSQKVRQINQHHSLKRNESAVSYGVQEENTQRDE